MIHSRLILAVLASLAAPAFAGSLNIVYKNDAGTTIFSPSAAISNVDATKFLTWCHAYYINTPSASTDSGCYNTWSNDVFNQMKASVNGSIAATASATAAAGITPIVVTPAQ